MLSFSQLQLVDLFFRFAAVGALLFIIFVWLEKNNALRDWVTRALMLCLSGYLILTAPIENAAYGHLRGLALLLTELLPYVLWCYAYLLIKPETKFKPLHWSVKVAALGMIVWFGYFFGLLQGRGAFHQVNHVFGLVLYAHIVFMAVFDLKDDLVPQRRKIRVFMAIFFGAYSGGLALLEIFDYALRDNAWFSLLNSVSILVLIIVIPRRLAKITDKAAGQPAQNQLISSEDTLSVSSMFAAQLVKMNELMAQKIYHQADFTIGVFADALKMPEHRLRSLINKELGYQNFSVFLNSYRIPEAQQALSSPERLKVPILTIALELGYGSIGPFNRAFKQHTSLTPSEYRKKFQNRP